MWGLFYKGPNPIHEDSDLMTLSRPKVLPPNTLIVKCQFMNVGGGGNENSA